MRLRCPTRHRYHMQQAWSMPPARRSSDSVHVCHCYVALLRRGLILLKSGCENGWARMSLHISGPMSNRATWKTPQCPGREKNGSATLAVTLWLA
eukprot:CAMPEP_0174738772 /NCGR_PEP_ID=MMETSP1094-20130205/70503_1 /TAXON_ID=156173 /ORGANISM="Chrysochromulina brevifilum, Strain UTEX LB 985" /LENGTH=94 /DNA_ID=CAMNT_0015942251 /DNA_START=117 /DNA_END=397 /DNA_ORIENTATION=+